MVPKRTKSPLRQLVFSSSWLILAVLLVSACGVTSTDMEPYSTPVTFETITTHKEQEFVILTGKLKLITECHVMTSGGGTDYCTMYLVSTETESGLEALTHLTVHAHLPYLIEGKDPLPNFMQFVGGIEDEHVRIFTDDGQTLTMDVPVRIIGKITRISQYQGETTVDIWVVKITAAK